MGSFLSSSLPTVRIGSEFDEENLVATGFFDQLQCDRLILTQKEFQVFPACVLSSLSIRSLEIPHNSLEEIPKSIHTLSHCLTAIDLQQNKFIKFPAALLSLSNLTSLSLQKNRLSDIPSEIIQLQQLQTLNLASNKFEVFPSCLGALPSLRELYLEYNSTLRPWIFAEELQGFQALEILNLSGKLVQLPPSIQTMKNLCQLMIEAREFPLEMQELSSLSCVFIHIVPHNTFCDSTKRYIQWIVKASKDENWQDWDLLLPQNAKQKLFFKLGFLLDGPQVDISNVIHAKQISISPGSIQYENSRLVWDSVHMKTLKQGEVQHAQANNRLDGHVRDYQKNLWNVKATLKSFCTEAFFGTYEYISPLPLSQSMWNIVGFTDGGCTDTTFNLPSVTVIDALMSKDSYSFILDSTGNVYVMKNYWEHTFRSLEETLSNKLNLPPIVSMSGTEKCVLFLDEVGGVWSFSIKDNTDDDEWSGIAREAGVLFCISDVFELPPIDSLSTSNSNIFLVDNDGFVWSFGDNRNQKLGRKGNKFEKTFAKVNLHPIHHVYINECSTIFIDNDFKIWGCGNIPSRQISGCTPQYMEPARFLFPSRAKSANK